MVLYYNSAQKNKGWDASTKGERHPSPGLNKTISLLFYYIKTVNSDNQEIPDFDGRNSFGASLILIVGIP